MPTYEYACVECDERFERVQAFTDPTLTSHEPGCGGRVRKLFGNVGVVFKGSGFYRNDSRGAASSSEGSSAPAEAKPDTAAAAGSKTEATTPAAAPAKTESSAPAPAAPAKASSTSAS